MDASEPRTQAVALRTLHSLLTALDSPPPAAQCAAWSNLVLQAMQEAADAVSDSEPPPKDILSVQVSSHCRRLFPEMSQNPFRRGLSHIQPFFYIIL